MKTFQPLTFDPVRCRKEAREFQKWLARRPLLDEKKHILPFFQKRQHLAALIGAYNPNVIRFNRLAFEYALFGDFTCDLVVGDAMKHSYSFIEFEDARPNSLFVKQGKKATREWSPRLDHGCSQIVDWFYKLEDMKKSDDFVARFEARSINYSGILVVGRDQYLLHGEWERLKWRRDNVVVASRNIRIVTFDELLEDLRGRLETFALAAEEGG